MFTFLPRPIIAIFIAISYTLLTFLLPIPILIVGLFYYLIPNKRWRIYCDRLMQAIGKGWGIHSNIILALFTRIHWNINGFNHSLISQKSYLLIANHQSWADIIIIQKVFNQKLPLCRYFIKKSLTYVPIIGWCCKLLHFPAMKRYSKALLEKKPELKGKDTETTRKACQIFQHIPVTLINFAEGTRFTLAKKKLQQSPYEYLLLPRAGGISFTLSALADYLQTILNVTIIYDQHSPTLWDIFTGKIKTITVDIKEIPVTKALIGDYQNDVEYRKQFQDWLNQLWKEKDKLIKSSY
ncbi:MAG: putative acyltransferase YihG [Legionellaceae bacterium]